MAVEGSSTHAKFNSVSENKPEVVLDELSQSRKLLMTNLESTSAGAASKEHHGDGLSALHSKQIQLNASPTTNLVRLAAEAPSDPSDSVGLQTTSLILPSPKVTKSGIPDEVVSHDGSPLSVAANHAVGMGVDLDNPADLDTDSAMSETMSSTASLKESIYQFIEENGRTYHAYNPGKYILPNDEAEQDRLDLQHHLFLLAFDGELHLAPLDPQKLHNVMDIGTGTGIWAIEFADRFPSASVVGTDLSPIQPSYVPPNCRFEVSDAEDEWIFHEKFDYIHGRALLTCFKDPASVISSAFSSLRPGGYLELQDPQQPIKCVDTTMDGTHLQEWSRVCIEAAEKTGYLITNSKNYGKYMEAAGFVDIVERHFFWPCNPWPQGKKEKLLGVWTQRNILDGINGMSMALLTRSGWSREEVEVFLALVRQDVMNRKIHSYADVVVFFGRKPH